ncbi:MAG TPA: outer membrane beta-barrel protein [Myxococcales bacterium]|nr:outer membrane beta-barrel protein [Myxococcales bacterium]
MRLRTAASLLLAAAPALAGVPEKGDGTITVLGGIRAIPGGEYQSETGAKHSLWHPGFLVGLGFQLDEELHGGIQLGYALDQYGDGANALKVRSFQILLAADTPLFQGTWYTVYGGGGIGYSLNTISRSAGDLEANSSLGFLALGFRFRISDHVGGVIEDRYSISSAAADPSALNSVNMGGNLLTAGIIFHFFSPQDKGHPDIPGG